MKLKCPGCGKILQVPDSAAGKVVRCQCGKQMRAPAGRPAAAAATKGGTAVATSRPSSAMGDWDPGLFDELTDDDLQPVAAPRSGSAPLASSPSGGGTLMKQYAPPGELIDVANSPGKRPGFLTFLGVINGLWAILYLVGTLALTGLLAMVPMFADAAEMDGAEKTILMLVVGVMIFATILTVATTVSCFVSHPLCWSIVLFSYSFAFGDRLITVVGMFRDGIEAAPMGKAVVALVVGFLFLVALHGDDVRAFYRTGNASLAKIAVPDVAGLLVGIGLTCAVVFLQ